MRSELGEEGGGVGRVRVWGGGGGTEVVLKGQHFSPQEPEFTLLLRTQMGLFGILPSI